METQNLEFHKNFTKNSKEKYYSGIGRRKRSIASVRIKEGAGKVFVNGFEPESYFNDKNVNQKLLEPAKLTGLEKKFDYSILTSSGGKFAQIDAVVLGLARALTKYDNSLRTTLKKAGYLTRDPREKERKKPGLKRARRAPQWSKR